MKRFVNSVISLSLLAACSVQAAYLDAVQAYQQNHFTDAQREFEQLRLLGNANAAFNLGIMAYKGQGEQVDLVKAAAYLRYAESLNHPRAGAALVELAPGLSAEQQTSAKLRFSELQQQQLIANSLNLVESEESRAAKQTLIQSPPKYPIEAAKAGISGYSRLRFVVSPDGEPKFIQVVDSYPRKVFDKESINAIKKWRYAKSEQARLMSVQLDFMLPDTAGDNRYINKLYEFAEQNKLWQAANAQYDAHQLTLSQWFAMVRLKLVVSPREDKDAELAQDLPSKALFGELQKATLRVAIADSLPFEVDLKDNKVTSVRYNTGAPPLTLPKAEHYIAPGLPLFKQPQADGKYVFFAKAGKKDVHLFTVQPMPSNWFQEYWLNRAARNGNTEAQRQLAMADQQWQDYLLSKHDEQALAWSALQLAMAGEQAQSKTQLEIISSSQDRLVVELIDYTKSLL